jgi:hypothetical protein
MPREPVSKPAPVSIEWLQQSLASTRHKTSRKAWRAVEAQHVVSTLRLTNNDPAAQDLLEHILEEHKPLLPPDAADLHYLLATPFRYPPTHHGSRFRAPADPGILYAAAERRTACAEMGYWRWRFVQDSAGLHEIPAAPQTLFQLAAHGLSIDIEHPPENYRDTQTLAVLAREAGVSLILYRSVRDPQHGLCLAVLNPAAFRPKQPLARETWYLTVTPTGAIWQREHQRFLFHFAAAK